MKFIKYILYILLAVLAIFCIVPLALPPTFRVEEKIIIPATPEKIYAQISSFRNWKNWDPWYARDSSLVYTYAGSAAGQGSIMRWKSIHSGDGQAEIIAAEPHKTLTAKIQINNFSTFYSTFHLTPADSGTLVHWIDSGSSGYLGRWFHLFADNLIKQDLQNGLQNLKQFLSKSAINELFRLSELSMSETNDFHLYYISDTCPLEVLVERQAACFRQLNEFLLANHLQAENAPLVIYHAWSPGKIIFDAAVPVSSIRRHPTGNIKTRKHPSCKAVSVTYNGEYAHIPYAYSRVIDSIARYGYTFTGPILEVYLRNPTADTVQETLLLFPVK
ncbi:MAG: SRPBCC family protein [Chitinophagales bacterium]|nr:SRPBCC family protein [Chitinophagales bacterium]MDW8419198.1 SRPBCC family protein [Chitinophagales bacterium]